MKSKTFKRFLDIAKPHSKTIILLSLLAVIINIIEILKPYLVKIVIDNYLSFNISKIGLVSINLIGITYLIIVILGNILDFISRMKTSKMGEEVLYEIRNKIYKYSQYANISFHDKTPAGKLYVSITSDVEDISSLFKDVVTTLFKDIISIISIVCIMLYFSLKLSLITFIVFPFVIIVSIILTNLLNNIYKKSIIIRSKISTFLAESIYGAKLIKIFNIEKQKEETFQKMTKEFVDVRTPSAIFIAHILATIVNVDKILVLNNGEIIEEGSHSELLNQNGYYAKLYNSYYQSLE